MWQESLWTRAVDSAKAAWDKYTRTAADTEEEQQLQVEWRAQGDKSSTTAFVKGLSAISGVDITYQIDRVAAELAEDTAESLADAINEYYVCKMDKIWNAGPNMRVRPFAAIVGAFALVTGVVLVWKSVIGVGNLWVTFLATFFFFPIIMLLLYDLEAGCSVQHPNPTSWIPWIGQTVPARIPFVPTRFADDLYTALDESLLPDDYLTMFDAIAVRDAPGDADRGKRGPIRHVADCSGDPYRFDDGVRIALYHVAKTYPTWRHTVPKWVSTGLDNTFVGNILDYYNATFIYNHQQAVLESLLTDTPIPTLDDCAHVAGYIHLIPSAVIALLTIGVVPSIVFLLLKAIVMLPLTQSSALRWFSYNARETNAVIYEAAEQATVQNTQDIVHRWNAQNQYNA